jgi:hypothetical protein
LGKEEEGCALTTDPTKTMNIAMETIIKQDRKDIIITNDGITLDHHPMNRATTITTTITIDTQAMIVIAAWTVDIATTITVEDITVDEDPQHLPKGTTITTQADIMEGGTTQIRMATLVKQKGQLCGR